MADERLREAARVFLRTTEKVLNSLDWDGTHIIWTELESLRAALEDRRKGERRISRRMIFYEYVDGVVVARAPMRNNRRLVTKDRRVDWKAKYEAMHMVAKELALHLRSSEFYGWKCETLIHCSPVAQKVLDKFAALEKEQNG